MSDTYSAGRHIDRLTMPILFIHDSIPSFSSATLRLYEKAKAPKELLMNPSQTAFQEAESGSDPYVEQIAQFYEAALANKL